jgi:hypothetical protein
LQHAEGRDRFVRQFPQELGGADRSPCGEVAGGRFRGDQHTDAGGASVLAAGTERYDVVVIGSGIAALDDQVKNDSSGLHNVTGIIGTGVSGTFLYIIAALNVVILAGIVKVFREMRSGRYDDEQLEEQLAKRGLRTASWARWPAASTPRGRWTRSASCSAWALPPPPESRRYSRMNANRRYGRKPLPAGRLSVSCPGGCSVAPPAGWC